MGGHQDASAFRREVVQELQDALCGLRVEVAGGLVGQDEFGGVEEGPGDGEALAFSSAELMGPLVALVFQPDGFEHLGDAPFAVPSLLPVGDLEDKLQVLRGGPVGQEFEVLKDDAQLPSEQVDPVALERGKVDAANGSGSDGEGQFAVERLEQAALARPSAADEVNELAGTGLEVHTAQDDVFLLVEVRAGERNQRGGRVTHSTE